MAQIRHCVTPIKSEWRKSFFGVSELERNVVFINVGNRDSALEAKKSFVPPNLGRSAASGGYWHKSNGEQEMTDDPKKNTEIKDEDLDKVAGGAGEDVDKPQDDSYTPPSTPTGGKQAIERI